jgi:hypothetical protein
MLSKGNVPLNHATPVRPLSPLSLPGARLTGMREQDTYVLGELNVGMGMTVGSMLSVCIRRVGGQRAQRTRTLIQTTSL